MHDIADKLTTISQEFPHEPSTLRSFFAKNIIKNSGALKYALCVAVAWANKLNSDADRLGALNQLKTALEGIESEERVAFPALPVSF